MEIRLKKEKGDDVVYLDVWINRVSLKFPFKPALTHCVLFKTLVPPRNHILKVSMLVIPGLEGSTK